MYAICIGHEMTFNSIHHSIIHEEAKLLQAVRAWSVTQRRFQNMVYFKKNSRRIQAWVLLYLEPEHETLRHSVTSMLRQVKEDHWMGMGMQCRISFQLPSYRGHFKMEDVCVCRSRTVRFGSLETRADVGNIYKCNKFLKPKFRWRCSVLCSTTVRECR
jgi:hypothetical protein